MRDSALAIVRAGSATSATARNGRATARNGRATARNGRATARVPTRRDVISDLPFPAKGGWIEVVSGVMFSGKSEELIRRVRRAVIARKKVQVFKSHLDARYAGLFSVSSHDGITVEAEPVDSAQEIARRLRQDTEVVAVDEAQFLDDGIIELANRLADDAVRVILAGTDVDFRGEPFGP